MQLNTSAHYIVSKLPMHISELRMLIGKESDASDSNMQMLDHFLQEALDARWMCVTNTPINADRKDAS